MIVSTGASTGAPTSDSATEAPAPVGSTTGAGSGAAERDAVGAGSAIASSAMAAAATAAAARTAVEVALRSVRLRVVSSTSDPDADAIAAAAAAGAADDFGASGTIVDSGLASGAGLRDARSAAVVSVVSDAATRWVCRFVVAAAAAALRAAGELDAEEVRAARAVLAASPRALAAFDDAAREAAVRFDPGFSDSSTGVGFASAALDAAFVALGPAFVALGPAFVALEAAFAAVLRAGRGLRAGFGGAWSPEAPVAAPAAAAGFTADGLDAPDLGVRGFDAGFGVASLCRRSARRGRGSGAPGALRGAPRRARRGGGPPIGGHPRAGAFGSFVVLF